jgi:ElaB/YqjD/DUF883 family membrane-anchored ribosome-binding protein
MHLEQPAAPHRASTRAAGGPLDREGYDMQDLPNEYAGAGAGSGATTWESGELRPAEPVPEGARARRLREEASQALRGAKDKVSAAYDRTTDQAQRAYDGARGYARNNPGMAAATVFAAGLGIGMLIGVRTTARAYRRGLLPAVAFALAQAVRDVFARLH